ncbi:MAG: serine/threonine-protein kinase [Acidobacteriota bacterium]
MTESSESSTPARSFGRYELIREIGRGAMGRVYLARDPAIDRQVALKTISILEALPEQERALARERFMAEARAAGGLLHPNIIAIFDVGEHEGMPFIAMEYVEGATLEKHCRPPGLLEPERIVDLISQVARALHAAHLRQIVHRDIKPANLMLTTEGSVKIADFGLAKRTTANLTQKGTILGTPYYMSPEQVMGRQLDGRSDLFSLAVVLYELLAGYRPFEAQEVNSVLYHIAHEPTPPLERQGTPLSHPLREILDRALAKNAEERFPNGEAMACALERSLRGRAGGVDQTVVLLGGPGMRRAVQRPRPHPQPRAAMRRQPAGAPKEEAPAATIGLRWLALACTGLLLGFFPTIVNRQLETPRPEPLVRSEPIAIDVPENARLRLDGVMLAGHMLPASAFEGGRHTLEVETPCERGEAVLEPGLDVGLIEYEPRTLRLPLESEPPGAEVWIDGEASGLRTPASLELPVCAAHQLELRLARHETVVLDLDLGQDWSSLVAESFILEIIPDGVIRVPEAPYEVVVWHGRQRVGLAGESITLPPGHANLRLRNAELFLDRLVAVEVRPGATQSLAVRFEAPGSLTVHARPSNCEVSVDGRSVGAPPILGLPLVPGGHKVRCRLKATGEEKVQTIQISSGRNFKCQFKF